MIYEEPRNTQRGFTSFSRNPSLTLGREPSCLFLSGVASAPRFFGRQPFFGGRELPEPEG